MRQIKKQPGFTLVETILYIGIVGLVGVAMIRFILAISTTDNKNYYIQEVNSNARIAMQVIEDSIRNADGISVASSTFITDPGMIWLTMPVGETNPTIIDLDGDDGRLRIRLGDGESQYITTADVRVTDLLFTRLSGSASETIQIVLTIESISNVSSDQTFSTTVTSTATTRN